jgi:hypothetical protein
MGCMEALNVAAKKVLGALKGAGGSIRALRLAGGESEGEERELEGGKAPADRGAPPLPLVVASAGLDRFLRIHSAMTRK